MKSPITGKEMRRHKERRQFDYRKDSFDIIYQYYVCGDTGEKFTDEQLDNLNLKLVHNQYRARYGIPFADEIREIRLKYDLSAAKMSEVLGLGANIYRLYEAGEMPTVANGRMIRMAQDPKEFRKCLELSRNVFDSHEFEKLHKKIDHNITGLNEFTEHFEQWLFGTKLPNIYNGFKVPSLVKTGCMVQFFAKKNRPFITSLNKLMFYADFGHFKQHGTGISGLVYKAIQKGPVPAEYGRIYNEIHNNGYVKIKEEDFGEYVGEKLYSGEKKEVPGQIFSETELEVLQKVSDKFKGWSSKKIVEASHTEKAWQHNAEDFGRISYEYSFDIKHLEE